MTSAPAMLMGGSAADWLIFGITYVGVAVGTLPFTRLNRSAIALLGAIAIVAAGRMTFPEALANVDWATVALLFAMMLLAGSLRVAGFYARVIDRITSAAHRPWALLIGIILAAAALSALFANDIICLAFAPILCVAVQRAGRRPLPYLMALATSSNIGSAATIIGNPQNMLIGQSAHLSFGHFTMVAAPLVLVCLGINVLVVAMVYRRELFGTQISPPPATDISPTISEARTDINPGPEPKFRPWHVTKTLLITAGLVLAFLFTGIPREIAALVAAGLVLISRTQEPRKVLAQVNWELILLFLGLFVVIGDVQKYGLLNDALHAIQNAGIPLYAPAPFAAITVVLSNLVSNVPAVLLLKPGLPMPAAVADHAANAWYLLAVVSTFAGNLTLLGSIANLIVAEQARPHGIKITFLEYLKSGVPLTLITTVLAVGYFWWLGAGP